MDEKEILRKNFEGYSLYCAGLPHYPKNFTRDSLVCSFIFKDKDMLKEQLKFCAHKQGTKKNRKSGEEPGKIFHEYPPFRLFGYNTEYNTCDSNALFLIGHEKYYQWTKDKSLIKKQKENIRKAVNNTLLHLNSDNLFIESPKFSGGKRFLLPTTYWKDTGLIKRFFRTPKYPVVYSLAHIQNLAGIRSAARILQDKILEKKAQEMKKALNKLWDKKRGNFYLAIDKKGKISATDSDTLHALYYLEKGDLTKEQLNKIIEGSKKLESFAGYRARGLEHRGMIGYWGHDYSYMVWPFEQAIIHAAAKKFKIKHLQEVSKRVAKFIKSKDSYEILSIKNNKVKGIGCKTQLWTMAAKHYFNNNL